VDRPSIPKKEQEEEEENMKLPTMGTNFKVT
jgi:hypothetical protein